MVPFLVPSLLTLTGGTEAARCSADQAAGNAGIHEVSMKEVSKCPPCEHRLVARGLTGRQGMLDNLKVCAADNSALDRSTTKGRLRVIRVGLPLRR